MWAEINCNCCTNVIFHLPGPDDEVRVRFDTVHGLDSCGDELPGSVTQVVAIATSIAMGTIGLVAHVVGVA